VDGIVAKTITQGNATGKAKEKLQDQVDNLENT